VSRPIIPVNQPAFGCGGCRAAGILAHGVLHREWPFRKVAELFGNSATFLVLPWTGLIIREPVPEVIGWPMEPI
jgi:hypothetical protein